MLTQTKRNWLYRLANPAAGFLNYLASLGASSWYGGDTVTSVAQELADRLDPTETAVRGSSTGVDTNDPRFLPHDGSHYVYLPGTVSNSITTPRPYATTHYTITKTDDSEVTGTTTADPVVIGGTAHSGSVKSVVLRETTSGGAIGANLVVADSIDTSSNVDAGQSSWVSSATGETWTVNRSTTGLKTTVVTRPVMVFDGSDDYLQLPASDTPSFTPTTGKYTVAMVVRRYSAAAVEYSFSSESASLNGFALWISTAGLVRARTGGSTDSADALLSPGGFVDGELSLTAGVVDNGSIYAYGNNNGMSAATDMTGVGTITHATPKVGRRADSAAYFVSNEIFDVLIFDGQALTENELNDIAANYGL